MDSQVFRAVERLSKMIGGPSIRCSIGSAYKSACGPLQTKLPGSSAVSF